MVLPDRIELSTSPLPMELLWLRISIVLAMAYVIVMPALVPILCQQSKVKKRTVAK